MYRVLLIFVFLCWTAGCAQYDQDKKRKAMVTNQLIARGINDPATLRAMRKVPREAFVPKSIREHAYQDNPLPIGQGQTISQPYIVAFMTQILQLKPNYKVLEIGTGSGYQAAVLAEIVRSVYTIEIVEELGVSAKKVFQKLGYTNVITRIGDGYNGWEEHAPFDAIIVTAGIEEIPQPLLDQLAEGGRMIIPVGPSNQRNLVLVTKKKGKIKTKKVLPVRFVPFVREKGEN
ncbi:protein-L-isoaspartate(D-aspartate) O-methyltransferase [Aquimarina gracilis]|uniref:Protein-L-isoaspartate O-methyltransferase n=1 Tax=Aquimarina gracilis TaxID=874422 RepID=A0ABU5ZX90_9FLAO|nr:protein-L-isoaspartate(D-aspartate) O-methyltransferase [Aquimarina gracilis]MEB3346468.1 protein-L-isoaspartate(D-aspartate) O-methyltransferase [Aquimarina gracilis]